MIYQYKLFRARADKTGLAAQFETKLAKKPDGKEVQQTFLTVAKQIKEAQDDRFSWGAKGEKVDASKKINIKLEPLDIGAIMAVFTNQVPATALYHEFVPKGKTEADKVVTQIKLFQYMKPGKDASGKPTDPQYAGVAFNILQGVNKFSFVAAPADIEILSVMFKQAILNHLEVVFNPV